jgi:hypothetical protein
MAKITVDLPQLEPTCFIMMPFQPTFQTMYERVIKPAVELAQLTCVRADEVFSKAQITHQIWDQIRSCRIVLAELTGRNPNVLYEIGLAHALGKPSIILTRAQDDVPFDLRAHRYLFYDTNDPFWGDNLKTQLTRMVEAAIASPSYGSIFSGIDVQGDITVASKAAVVPEPEPVAAVAGGWQGLLRFSGEDEDTVWNVFLDQNGSQLIGTLTASSTFGGELCVVQEAVAGDVSGTRVRFNGTSYTYLQRGKLQSWRLDSFAGVIKEDGSTIIGRARDEGKQTAEVALVRTLPHVTSLKTPAKKRKRRPAA